MRIIGYDPIVTAEEAAKHNIEFFLLDENLNSISE
jgi:hypothetical protein